MRKKTALLLTVLPWLAVPLLVSAHLLLWERIPEKLAVHFDYAGNPDGWMSRGQSLAFNLAVLLFILGTATFQLASAEERRTPYRLALLNLCVLFVTLVFLGLLKYNVTGSLF